MHQTIHPGTVQRTALITVLRTVQKTVQKTVQRTVQTVRTALAILIIKRMIVTNRHLYIISGQ